jgi:hypothetical protein
MASARYIDIGIGIIDITEVVFVGVIEGKRVPYYEISYKSGNKSHVENNVIDRESFIACWMAEVRKKEAFAEAFEGPIDNVDEKSKIIPLINNDLKFIDVPEYVYEGVKLEISKKRDQIDNKSFNPYCDSCLDIGYYVDPINNPFKLFFCDCESGVRAKEKYK